MIPIFFVYALIVTISIAFLIVMCTYIYIKFFLPNRIKKVLLENRFEFSELISNIDTIVAVEIAIYEQYLENSNNISFTTITNTQFINIYKDLSARIIKAVSPQFYECAEMFMMREELQTYITQRVYNYLAGKVKPGNEETADILIS